jgi:Rrf2 family protein
VLLSRTAQLALAALPLLDPRGPSGPGRLTRDLASEAGLPAPFLAKVLERLAETGILRSRRGRGGGFVLGRPAEEITLADVVLALEGKETLESFYPPFAGPLGELFAKSREETLAILLKTTLAELRTPKR